jgi:serpin B
MRTAMLVAGGMFLLNSIGCSTRNGPLNTDNTPVSTPFAIAKSTSARETAAVPESLLSAQATSINTFAVALYKQLGAQAGNLFFSPYSITAALGMTEAGAQGTTQSQIRQALSVTLPGDAFHAAINALDLSLMGHAQATDGLTLNMVNSTWTQSGWDFRVAYLDVLSRYYGAGVNLLDFIAAPDPSRIIINTWVADQTNQRIKDLIPQGAITSDTRLVLTNAIYFLASWLYRFDASLTTNQTFTKLDNSAVSAPLMQLGGNGTKLRMNYARVGTARAIDLPYKGDRLRMTVLLPDKGSFPAFESSISVATVNALVQALDSTDLPPVRLPKFTFTSGSVSLVPALQSLGMTDAFDDTKADFSGIDGRRDLVITDVIHKAFIAVDEKGTEAAAATAVIIGVTSMPVDPPSFVADRPFIFLIRDRQTGVILFMGRIVDPTVQG